MIELTPLARPYAKAVFDAALDLNKLDETAKDLFNISLAAKEEHLAKVIEDPTLSKKDLENINKKIIQQIKDAAKYALDSPFPTEEDLYTNVYL